MRYRQIVIAKQYYYFCYIYQFNAIAENCGSGCQYKFENVDTINLMQLKSNNRCGKLMVFVVTLILLQ